MRIAISPALAHLVNNLEVVGPEFKPVPVVDITLVLVKEHSDWWDIYSRRLSPFYCDDEEAALRVFNSLVTPGNKNDLRASRSQSTPRHPSGERKRGK